MRAALEGAVVLGLAGCNVAPDFTNRPLDKRSGDTQYRIDDFPNRSFMVYVRQDVYRFVPQADLVQEDRRRSNSPGRRSGPAPRGGG